MIIQLTDFFEIILIASIMRLQAIAIKYLKTINYYLFSMEIDAILVDHTLIIYRLNHFSEDLRNANSKFILIQIITFITFIFHQNLNYLRQLLNFKSAVH